TKRRRSSADAKPLFPLRLPGVAVLEAQHALSGGDDRHARLRREALARAILAHELEPALGAVDAVALGHDALAVECDQPPRGGISALQLQVVAVVIAAEDAELGPAPRERLAEQERALAALDCGQQPVLKLLPAVEQAAGSEREQRDEGRDDPHVPRRTYGFAFGAAAPGMGPTIVAGSR